jgi:hypothetical protein
LDPIQKASSNLIGYQRTHEKREAHAWVDEGENAVADDDVQAGGDLGTVD